MQKYQNSKVSEDALDIWSEDGDNDSLNDSPPTSPPDSFGLNHKTSNKNTSESDLRAYLRENDFDMDEEGHKEKDDTDSIDGYDNIKNRSNPSKFSVRDVYPKNMHDSMIQGNGDQMDTTYDTSKTFNHSDGHSFQMEDSFTEKEEVKTDKDCNIQGANTFSWGEMSGGVLEDLTNRNVKLTEELRIQKQKVKELQILLASVEPIQGLEHKKFLKLIKSQEAKSAGTGNNNNADYRDKKILDLARKNRSLNLSLQNEKVKTEKLGKANENYKLQELTNANFIEQQKAKSKSRIQSNSGKQKDSNLSQTIGQDSINSLKQENDKLSKHVVDLRNKLNQAEEDNKKLFRTLKAEIGCDDQTLTNKILPYVDSDSSSTTCNGNTSIMAPSSLSTTSSTPSTWKGRAQQIIKLRSKVKKLEKIIEESHTKYQHSEGKDSESDGEIENGTPLGSNKFPLDRGNDEKTRSNNKVSSTKSTVSHLEKAKLQTETTERLESLLDHTKRKFEAGKARINLLEGENQKFKDQIKFLLKTSKSDHCLIDALKEELEILNLKYAASTTTDMNRKTSNRLHHKARSDIHKMSTEDNTSDGGGKFLVKHSNSTSSFMGHQNASMNSNIMMKMNNILKSSTGETDEASPGNSQLNMIASSNNDKSTNLGSSMIPVCTGRPKIIAKVKRQESKSADSNDAEAAVPLDSRLKFEGESKERLGENISNKLSNNDINKEKPCETEFTYRLEIDNTDGALNNCFIAERPEETIKRLRQQMRGK